MTLQRQDDEYQRRQVETLSLFERLEDGALSPAERLDVINRLLLEILRHIYVGIEKSSPVIPQVFYGMEGKDDTPAVG